MRFMDKLQQKLFILTEKEFMGLMAIAGNQPTLKEAVIAKNYLNEKELRAMGQLVSGYLDFAERQAEREQVMTMSDWAAHLDRILTTSLLSTHHMWKLSC